MTKDKENKIEALNRAAENPYVAKLQGKRLVYTLDFYKAMYKYITEDELTPIQAYEACGFNVEELGEDRAYSTARRAEIKAKNNGFAIKPSAYNGTIPREQMGDLTPEEELAYLKARNIYLETLVEFQKKTPSQLEEMYMSLRKGKL